MTATGGSYPNDAGPHHRRQRRDRLAGWFSQPSGVSPSLIRTLSSRLLPGSSPICSRLTINKGGAEVRLVLMAGDVPCVIRLTRNGNVRERTVKVESDQRYSLQLNFSVGPGTIDNGTSTVDAHPQWHPNQKPAAQRLSSFLQYASGGLSDDRLDINIGLLANRVID